MSRSFFRVLSNLERQVLLYRPAQYEQHTKNTLKNLITFIESGNLGNSPSRKFIMQNFRLSPKELVYKWNNGGSLKPKTETTMRKLISVLSDLMYSIFGEEDILVSAFSNNDKKSLDYLNVCIEQLSLGDFTGCRGLFPEAVFSYCSKNNMGVADYDIADCKKELTFLRSVMTPSLEKQLKELDAGKLSFLLSTMNQPLLNPHLNKNKLEVLALLNNNEKASEINKSVADKYNISSMDDILRTAEEMSTQPPDSSKITDIDKVLNILKVLSVDGLKSLLERVDSATLAVALDKMKK